MSVSNERMDSFLRPALYKAKRLDNGEWICGGLEIRGENYYICCVEVDYRTLCAEIGLKFRNGKPIFEYDILSNESEFLGNTFD